MSTDAIIATYRLDNGLDLIFIDRSKQIADDRWCIRVTIRMIIPIEKKWFDNHRMDEVTFQHMRRELGDVVCFEQTRERNFVSIAEKTDVITTICENTKETAKRYFCLNDFAAKYILKQYSEKLRLL